jgi:hypothetical protein
MPDLGDLVDILVTYAALERMEVPIDRDALARFGKHRVIFEQIANHKFVGDETEEDGSIAVLPGDF